MSIYKEITRENLTTSQKQVFKNHTISSSDAGIVNYKFNSNSSSLSTEGSFYNSLKLNFYLSGSDYSVSESRYNAPHYTKFSYNSFYPQHLNKFHEFKEGIIYSIPQQYFGEYIKPGSFELNEESTAYKLTIKDDKYGNLYAENSIISASSNSSISSSENYVGNIFYKTGLVTITETGSFSGSVKYTDLGNNYSMSFDASKHIYISEYNLLIKPNEFNVSNNPSSRAFNSSSNPNHPMTSYLANQLTASGWTPYFNTVGLYDDDNNLVAKARYPQNIQTRKDIPMILKIKLDF